MRNAACTDFARIGRPCARERRAPVSSGAPFDRIRTVGTDFAMTLVGILANSDQKELIMARTNLAMHRKYQPSSIDQERPIEHEPSSVSLSRRTERSMHRLRCSADCSGPLGWRSSFMSL
jgi:hypothetical protein